MYYRINKTRYCIKIPRTLKNKALFGAFHGCDLDSFPFIAIEDIIQANFTLVPNLNRCRDVLKGENKIKIKLKTLYKIGKMGISK